MGAARRRWGQHWLASDSLARGLVAGIRPRSGDRFLEIGPGRGKLTRALLEHPVRILAVEIDPACCERLEPLVAESEGRLRVENLDVLEADDRIPWEEGPFRLVGNLPYNVSSPVLRWTVERFDQVVDAHYMLQREVAERVATDPGGRTYGYLSVMVQAGFEVDLLERLSPGAFRPQPKVESAFVRLRPRDEAPGDRGWLAVARAAFAHRRKKLSNALALGGWSSDQIASACAASGVDPDDRAERLAPEDYRRLAAALERSP